MTRQQQTEHFHWTLRPSRVEGNPLLPCRSAFFCGDYDDFADNDVFNLWNTIHREHGLIYFENKLDILFCFCAQLPFPHDLSCAELTRRAPASGKNRSSAYVLCRRTDPGAVSQLFRNRWKHTHWFKWKRNGSAAGAETHRGRSASSGNARGLDTKQ